MTSLVLMFVALLQAQESSVEGLTVRAGTTEPVPYARVMLTKVDGRHSDVRLADADDRGRFAFRNVAAGAYRVSAQHDAFVRSDSATVIVAPGRPVRLTVTMTPTGVITGRVVDEYGDPVAKAFVRATLKESSFETQTNDLGEYRLFGLPPGAYTLSVSPYLAPRLQNGRVVVPGPPGPYSRGEGQSSMSIAQVVQDGDFIPFMALRGETHARVYYPGTTDAAAAAAIEVSPGAVVGGFNLTTRVLRAGL